MNGSRDLFVPEVMSLAQGWPREKDMVGGLWEEEVDVKVR